MSLKVLFQNKWRKKNKGSANPGSLEKWSIKWKSMQTYSHVVTT